MEQKNFNRKRLRKAEFITLPNALKAKVGNGGLSEQILDQAQNVMEQCNTDFVPMGERYLTLLIEGIENAKKPSPDSDSEELLYALIYPAMQLKANGGMFRYPLVTEVSDRLVQYLEVIERADKETLEIVSAFYATLRLILHEKLAGPINPRGRELQNALAEACERYFKKHPDNLQSRER